MLVVVLVVVVVVVVVLAVQLRCMPFHSLFERLCLPFHSLFERLRRLLCASSTWSELCFYRFCEQYNS